MGVGVPLPKIGLIRNETGILRVSPALNIYPASIDKAGDMPLSKLCIPPPPIKKKLPEEYLPSAIRLKVDTLNDLSAVVGG